MTNSGMTNMINRLLFSAIQNPSLSKSRRPKLSRPVNRISVSPSHSFRLQRNDFALGMITNTV